MTKVCKICSITESRYFYGKLCADYFNKKNRERYWKNIEQQRIRGRTKYEKYKEVWKNDSFRDTMGGWNTFVITIGGIKFFDEGIYNREDRMSRFDVIYMHSFAKAFFGDYEKQELPSNIKVGGNFINIGSVKIDGLEKWQYHLQQMVISEDPIKYLEQYL